MQQPEVVIVLARVVGKFEKVPAEQFRLIATAFGQAVIGAVAFEVALAEVLAARPVDKAAGVVVILQIRQRRGLGVAIFLEGGFHQQARLLEVVIAAGDAAGAGFQANGKALDYRLIGGHAVVLQISGGLAELAEGTLVIAEDNDVALGAVLEVVVNTFLLAQALDEVQVALVVLHAVVPLGINRWAEQELIAAFDDAMLLQHLSNDLRHRQVLENPQVGAQGQITQLRHDAQFVAGQALAGFGLGDLIDQAVNAQAVWGKGEKGTLMQQALQIQLGVLADQFQLETVGLADGCVLGVR